jgi:hypothetical protein
MPVVKLSDDGGKVLFMRLKSKRSLSLAYRAGNETAGRRMASLAILIASLAFCSGARAEVIVSRYAVSLSGLHLGDAILHTTLSAERYKVAVSADVGILLLNINVRGEASGTRTGAKLSPDRFRMVMSGGEDSAVDIHFADSAATSAKITPPLPARVLNNRVPLTEAHLRDVLDPLSALLVASLRSPSSANPCHDVLPIFTGYARFDVSLRPKAAGEARGESNVVTCQVRYVAIAGHPRSGGNSASAPQNLQLEIDFKRLSRPHLWLLQHLSLPTPMGTVTVDRAETRAG